jgi:Protein of unknown function (DUF3306)
MANDDTPAGFLSRWSRRKIDVREGRPLDEPKPTPPATKSDLPTVAPSASAATGARAVPVSTSQNASVSDTPSSTHPDGQAPKAAPTLADAQQLTPESDFTSFMARGVAPDVKNAAMKKLFADPHFNVMDRLDIYIDDYSQPDPLPLAMLRQMTSAKTLNLFDDETEDVVETPVGDKPSTEETKVVAQSVPAENNSNPEPITHDHADLRLQPDPTARPEGTEPKPV